MRELRCLSASGQLGFRIPVPALLSGLAKRPDFIGADMGSTDHGPYYLGSGGLAQSPDNVRRDLELLLTRGLPLGVPIIIGTAGTAGGEPHLHTVAEIIRAVAAEHRLSFPMALIHSEINKEYLRLGLRSGRVKPYPGGPPLREDDITSSVRTVAQMGIEPIIRALAAGAQVILAGRACDTSIFAAVPARDGFDMGLAMHMAKIIECTSLCAEPGGRDAMLAYLRPDHFILESQDPAKRCTPRSVAAHSLYEQPDPFRVRGPGGEVDLSRCHYEAVDERTVRVSGSRWVPAPSYAVKLEGACRVGHRYFALGAIRDPIFIAQIDPELAAVQETAARLLADSLTAADYQLRFRVYGQNGVMGAAEPKRHMPAHEVLVLIDAIARDAAQARTVCAVARYTLLHHFYPGIMATAGNLAVPFGPGEFDAGDVYRFHIYSLLELDNPCEPFPMEMETVGQ